MNKLAKSLILSFGLAAACPAGTAAQEGKAAQNTEAEYTALDVRLKGYVFGFPIITARYAGGFNENAYSVRADLTTSGLGALLKKLAIWATTTGFYDDQGLQPLKHVQQNLDKKNRRVEMNYGKDAVDVKIVPRLGSQGKPPATPAERFAADDTLSAMLNLMMRGHKFTDKPCTGTIPVFDSKQHYNLRLQPAGTKKMRAAGFKGTAVRCLVYYEPVSGFDPEDLPSQEEKSKPIELYLANYPEYGIYIPLKMSYKISGFTASVRTKSIQIDRR